MIERFTWQTVQALVWFRDHEPVGWFDKTAPCHSMRKRLEKRGLIERLPDHRVVKLVKFRLTEVARAALRERGWLK